MFKVGDRIVKIKGGFGSMIKVGMEVVVIDHPEGKYQMQTVSVAHIPELKDGEWFTTDFDNYILAEVYNSPLYQALKEDE